MIRIGIFALISALLIGSGQAAPAKEGLGDKRRQQLADKFEQLTIPIVFYGKVEDLDGNPVPDARVKMRLTRLPPTPMLPNQIMLEQSTGPDGRFKIEATGFQLFLDEIIKEGYQYHFKYNPNRGYRFHKERKEVRLGQIQDKPVVFKVRKKGPPALVLTGHAGFQLMPGPNSVRIFDLMRQSWTYPRFLKTEKLNFKDWCEDIKISLDGAAPNFQFIIEAMNENTGLAKGEREQYKAPASGYKPKVVVPINELRKDIKADYFVKGRGGQFYSVLRVDLHALKDSVYIDIAYGTNPNGSRNLEYSPELYQEYRQKKYGRAAD